MVFMCFETLKKEKTSQIPINHFSWPFQKKKSLKESLKKNELFAPYLLNISYI